jgi:hypothetical protein
MIVKHFYCNEWHFGEDWENTDHIFGVPDSDMQVEQNKKSIAASLEISDNEKNMEEVEDERLSLPPHRYRQNVQASTWRVKRADK